MICCAPAKTKSPPNIYINILTKNEGMIINHAPSRILPAASTGKIGFASGPLPRRLRYEKMEMIPGMANKAPIAMIR